MSCCCCSLSGWLVSIEKLVLSMKLPCCAYIWCAIIGDAKFISFTVLLLLLLLLLLQPQPLLLLSTALIIGIFMAGGCCGRSGIEWGTAYPVCNLLRLRARGYMFSYCWACPGCSCVTWNLYPVVAAPVWRPFPAGAAMVVTEATVPEAEVAAVAARDLRLRPVVFVTCM